MVDGVKSDDGSKSGKILLFSAHPLTKIADTFTGFNLLDFNRFRRLFRYEAETADENSITTAFRFLGPTKCYLMGHFLYDLGLDLRLSAAEKEIKSPLF